METLVNQHEGDLFLVALFILSVLFVLAMGPIAGKTSTRNMLILLTLLFGAFFILFHSKNKR